MKKNIQLIAVFFFTCHVVIAQISGTYLNTTEPKKEIIFRDKSFIYRYQKRKYNFLYHCADTIAFGNWSEIKKSKLIELNSYELVNMSVVRMSVKESSQKGVREIQFIITNPIETNHRVFNSSNEEVRSISYGVGVKSDCIDWQGELVEEKFNSNKFSIVPPDNCAITGFTIYIYPTDFLRGWPEDQPPHILSTFSHDLIHTDSNIFEIEIPVLTHCLIGSMKLKQDYMLIENSNLIKWDGEYYKKQK